MVKYAHHHLFYHFVLNNSVAQNIFTMLNIFTLFSSSGLLLFPAGTSEQGHFPSLLTQPWTATHQLSACMNFGNVNISYTDIVHCLLALPSFNIIYFQVSTMYCISSFLFTSNCKCNTITIYVIVLHHNTVK